MASWHEILEETTAPSIDFVRRKYLKAFSALTGRNVIAYYSGFLTNPNQSSGIIDNDMNGFMNAIHGLDRNNGLDLILHTPGGTVSAAGAIVSYLKQMFKEDIRCFIPQIAMSAGTMIACSCKEIWMGRQSSIGPIDPQFGAISTGEVIEEFGEAIKDIKKNPMNLPIWQIRLSKYPPAFLGQCQKAAEFSKELVREWLITNMFKGDTASKKKAQAVVRFLSDHGKTKQHDRHISAIEASKIGLKIEMLEQKGHDAIQDAVLSVHHAFMLTFSKNTSVIKIIENHLGHAVVNCSIVR
jgi:hypothetical protein